MTKYRMIVAGGRDYSNQNVVNYYIDRVKDVCDSRGLNLVIVCGMATGADTLGRNYAISNGLEVLEFPANWNRYGKSAGYIRNKEMGNVADSAIVFWDGRSKGSKLMIDIMHELKKPVIAISYDGKVLS
jgi:hypothetical protein